MSAHAQHTHKRRRRLCVVCHPPRPAGENPDSRPTDHNPFKVQLHPIAKRRKQCTRVGVNGPQILYPYVAQKKSYQDNIWARYTTSVCPTSAGRGRVME